MKIKAIAFDIDGTLYPAYALNVRLGRYAASHGRFLLAFAGVRRDIHALSALPFLQIQGDKLETGGLGAALGQAAGSGLLRRGRAAALASSPLFAEEARLWSIERPQDRGGFRHFQAELLALRLHLDVREAEFRTNLSIYAELEEYFCRVPLFRSLMPCLDALKSAGFRLAVLSDFPANTKISRLGLDDRFAPLLCSEDSGCLKPGQRPFRQLAAGLDLAPAEILYVGNSSRYDVAGARAAGMRAALLKPVSPFTPRFPAMDRASSSGPASSCGPGLKADFLFSRWSELFSFACGLR